MRRALGVTLLAGGSACVGFNIRASDECASICRTAADCGFVPSALGWAASGSVAEAQEDCVRRCGNSPTDDPTVAQMLACFASQEATVPRWCTSEAGDDAEYATLWQHCAEISACLSRSFDGDELRGEVTLKVQLIEWSEYQTHLGLALADYPATTQADARAIESCQPALCSSAVCSSLQCELDSACLSASTGDAGTATDGLEEACSEVCELSDGEVCDTRLCRVGHLSISMFCEDLGAQKISLRLYERDRTALVDVFQDVEAGINVRCEMPTLTFDPDVALTPGPLKVTATVEGELTGAELAAFGYFEDGEEYESEAVTAYCMEFIGPAMTVRAGEAEVVVPVAERASLAGLKDALWRRCAAR